MDDQKIIEFYQSGKSCEEIAGYFDCTSQAISKRLKKLNVQTRRIAGYYTPKQLAEIRDQVAQLRSQNLTFKQIEEALGISGTSAWEHYKHLEE